MKQSKKTIVRLLQKILINKGHSYLLKIFFFLRSFKKFKRSINTQKNFSIFSKQNLNEINNFEYKITSQNNEDGIIDYIFTKIPNNKYFCEIGFSYYEFNSLNLIKNGWSGKLIDANKNDALALETNLSFFFPKARIEILNNFVTKDNINDLVYGTQKKNIIDFFSIDIDGNDYWVIKNLVLENINVICVEYNHWLGKNKKTIKYNLDHKFLDDGIFGASLSAMNDLLNSKGFYLVAVESSGTNAFFVNKKYSNKFKILSPDECFKSVGRFYSEEKKKYIFRNVKNSNFFENI